MRELYRHPPPVVAHAEGVTFTDLDGNRFRDFNLCDMSVLAGWAHPVVARAAADRLAAGSQFLLPSDDARARDRACGASRPAEVALHAVIDAGQRGGPAHLPRRHRTAGRPVLRRQVPRSRRRAAVRRARPRRARGARRPGGRRGGHAHRAVQRPRRRGAGARASRRRLCADRAGADQRRRRPARAGLPRGRARAVHALRRLPRIRRDPYARRQARRTDPDLGPAPRRRDPRQGHCRRPAHRHVRAVRRARGDRHRGRRQRGGRQRRDDLRLRGRHGRRARVPHRGPDRAEPRSRRDSRRAAGRRHRRGRRLARSRLARAPPSQPLGHHAPAGAAARRGPSP